MYIKLKIKIKTQKRNIQRIRATAEKEQMFIISIGEGEESHVNE